MRTQPSILVAIILILVTVGYGVFQARTLIIGPSLTVTRPTPGTLIETATYGVRGHTKRATHITLNGRTIPLDPTGNFSETLVTPEGYDIYTVQITDRFGKQVTATVEIVGRPPEPRVGSSTDDIVS